MFSLSLAVLAHSALSNSISLFIIGNRNVLGMSWYPSSLTTPLLTICPTICSVFFQLPLIKGAVSHEKTAVLPPPLTWDQTHSLGACFPGEQHALPIFSCLLLGPQQAEKKDCEQITNGTSITRQPLFFVMMFSYHELSLSSPIQTSWGILNLPASFYSICPFRESLRNIYSFFGICCLFHKLFLASPIKTYPGQNSFQFPI